MKRYVEALFCGVLLLASAISNMASAQTGSIAAAQPHVNKAWAAAYEPGHDLTFLYEILCRAAVSERGPVEPLPEDSTPPSLAEWQATSPEERRITLAGVGSLYAEPTQVFDNLYFLGHHDDAIWALTTSEGIILFDDTYDYQVKELVTDGLIKVGLDPTQIKYLIRTHTDIYTGGKYIQDTYQARVIMAEGDWAMMEQQKDAAELKPKKDIVATDGMKVTLGDTTVTLYVTPGHTPGTISTLIPLKDGDQQHVGVLWGGINPRSVRHGVRYYPNLQEAYKTWVASIVRFQDIAATAGADVYLTLHPFYDKALEKMNALKYRKLGDPHPFVSKDNLDRFLTIEKECTEAQWARLGK